MWSGRVRNILPLWGTQRERGGTYTCTYTCTIHMYSTHVQYTCTVHMYNAHAQYTCRVGTACSLYCMLHCMLTSEVIASKLLTEDEDHCVVSVPSTRVDLCTYVHTYVRTYIMRPNSTWSPPHTTHVRLQSLDITATQFTAYAGNIGTVVHETHTDMPYSKSHKVTLGELAYLLQPGQDSGE